MTNCGVDIKVGDRNRWPQSEREARNEGDPDYEQSHGQIDVRLTERWHG
jgi:hypothetical protein